MISLKSKFRGCLIGAVVGDCLGAHFECRFWNGEIPTQQIKNVLSEKCLNNKQKYTDDTAMARSVARSLIENNKFNASNLATLFYEEFYDSPHRGYGQNVTTVFSKLKHLLKYNTNITENAIFQPASEQFGGKGSYGNGAAMRIAPAGLFGHNLTNNELTDLVKNISKITHSHDDAINGAILIASLIKYVLQIDPSSDLIPKDICNVLLDQINNKETNDKDNNDDDNDDSSSNESKKTYADKILTIENFLKDEPKADCVIDMLGHDVSAFNSVPTAIYSFLKNACNSNKNIKDKFYDTIIESISYGGDTDTIASMTGAIAGAYYGEEAICKKWKDCCEGVTDAIEFADKLYELK